MSVVEVVSAVIVRKGRLLFTQRRAEKDFPFTWESPGGKVDAGETHHQALRRELREELSIGACDIRAEPSWTGRFDGAVSRPDRAVIDLSFYLVESWAGEVKPCEGQGIGWFTADEIARLTLAPGNARALDVLQRLTRVWDAPSAVFPPGRGDGDDESQRPSADQIERLTAVLAAAKVRVGKGHSVGCASVPPYRLPLELPDHCDCGHDDLEAAIARAERI